MQQTLSGPPKYKGLFGTATVILREEGFSGLTRGLAPAIVREMTYSAIRLGLYDAIRSNYILKIDAEGKQHGEETLWKKIMAGMVSGGIGCALCSPSDLIKVQMQASTPDFKPVYPSMTAAVRTVVAKSGYIGLWAGVGPNVLRAAMLTASQLPSYDHSKHLLFQTGWGWVREGLLLHTVCSMIAGVVSATSGCSAYHFMASSNHIPFIPVTSPADVIKSRVMNDHTRQYSSALDCLFRTVRNEGAMALFKGWVPNWMRLGPHSLVTFLVLEQLRRLAGVSPV